jgi:hypothetical protein
MALQGAKVHKPKLGQILVVISVNPTGLPVILIRRSILTDLREITRRPIAFASRVTCMGARPAADSGSGRLPVALRE